MNFISLLGSSFGSDPGIALALCSQVAICKWVSPKGKLDTDCMVSAVSNGVCGSTCAMFTTLMKERFNTKVAVVGGKPGEPIEYKGMIVPEGLLSSVLTR